jgi:hypothetical protein
MARRNGTRITLRRDTSRRKVNRTNRKVNRTMRKVNRTNRKVNRTNRKVNRTNRKVNRTNRKVNRTNRKVNRGGGVMRRLRNLKNNIITPRTGDDDGPQDVGMDAMRIEPDPDDMGLPPEVIFELKQGKKAMEEQLHNMFIRGRKDCGNKLPITDPECYTAFLKRDLHGDWSNEFVVDGEDRRDNKHHHSRWDKTTDESKYEHVYTNADDKFSFKECVTGQPPVKCEDGQPWNAE